MNDQEKINTEYSMNRIKAWVNFNDGNTDEDTQLLIDDIKLLFDMISERNARIAELKALFKKSHEEQIMQIKYEIAIEFKSALDQKDKQIAELLDDNVRADNTIEIYYNKIKALEFEVEKKDKIISELKKRVEGMEDE